MSESATKHPVVDACNLLNTLDREARDAGLATELDNYPDPSLIPAQILDFVSPSLGIGVSSASLGLMIGYLPGGVMTVMNLTDFFSGSVEVHADSPGLDKVAETVRSWIKNNAPTK